MHLALAQGKQRRPPVQRGAFLPARVRRLKGDGDEHARHEALGIGGGELPKGRQQVGAWRGGLAAATPKVQVRHCHLAGGGEGAGGGGEEGQAEM